MRKILASTLAAVTAAGAVAATPGPADARTHSYPSYSHHHDGGAAAAAAIIAGVAGLAIGSALSSSGSHSRNSYYRNGYYYDPRYESYGGSYYGDRSYYDSYGYGYGYAPRYRTCIRRERVWDPYIGERVTIERRYRC